MMVRSTGLEHTKCMVWYIVLGVRYRVDGTGLMVEGYTYKDNSLIGKVNLWTVLSSKTSLDDSRALETSDM